MKNPTCIVCSQSTLVVRKLKKSNLYSKHLQFACAAFHVASSHVVVSESARRLRSFQGTSERLHWQIVHGNAEA